MTTADRPARIVASNLWRGGLFFSFLSSFLFIRSSYDSSVLMSIPGLIRWCHCLLFSFSRGKKGRRPRFSSSYWMNGNLSVFSYLTFSPIKTPLDVDNLILTLLLVFGLNQKVSIRSRMNVSFFLNWLVSVHGLDTVCFYHRFIFTSL